MRRNRPEARRDIVGHCPMTALLPSRNTFPEPSPRLCVTFFTCEGTDVAGTVDLQHTYTSAVTYLDAQSLPYELVWLDNGGSEADHDAFIRRGAT